MSGEPARDYSVLHADIDAFFAAVEQVRDPRLRGRPVIVGNGVIASCSYEARRFGLRAGMALAEARRLCPQAVILDGTQSTYAAFAERVYEHVGALTPCLDTYLDECFGDLAGTERLHGDRLACARRLKDAIRDDTGLTVTVGLGPNRMLAKMAGKRTKPDGLGAVRAADADEFLCARPIGELLGVGPAHARTLLDMNVRTVAGLRALPRCTLAALFGAHGEVLYERARGRDTRAVTQREIPLSVSRETAFHADTGDHDEITGMLCYLAGRAGRTVRGLGLAARGVAVRVGYADGPMPEAQTTLDPPSALDPELFRAAERLFARLHARRVLVRRVGVTLSRFVEDGARQTDLLTADLSERDGRLAAPLDRLRERYGDVAVVSGRSLHLLSRLERAAHGFVLRTPSLTK
jgi:DNA polymerase-4